MISTKKPKPCLKNVPNQKVLRKITTMPFLKLCVNVMNRNIKIENVVYIVKV
jgi:hypothetical protein